MFLTPLAIITASIFLIKYMWRRRKLYYFSSKLSGPIALPIIGNALTFACHSDDIFDRVEEMLRSYPHPLRFWLGPKLVVIFSDLKHVEKIMSSTKITYKGFIYKFLDEFIGNGLIVGAGPKWKDDRKMIQPMFDLNFVKDNVALMQKHANLLINNFENLVDKGEIDIHQIVHYCCFDIIADIIYGMEIGSQNGRNLNVVKYFSSVYPLVYERMLKPWLHPSILFNISSNKKKSEKILQGMNSITYKAINKSLERISSHNSTVNNRSEPVIDKITKFWKQNSEYFTPKELKDHLVTLVAAAEDTATMTVAMVCICLGMYPEYQDTVMEEIREVFGDKPREVLYEDLTKLKYLEMCIRDTLRLATIAPFIMRHSTQELNIGDYVIPKDCEVVIPIFDIHRNPSQWKNPLHFHPDHFLADEIKTRHPYAYLPFSMGPRACIGKHLGLQLIKLLMANILQNYQFKAEGKFPDIKFKADISVRPRGGYKCTVLRRKTQYDT